jgi:hypothetical protein
MAWSAMKRSARPAQRSRARPALRESAKARHGVEPAKAVGGEQPRVEKAHVEAMAPTRGVLRARQGDTQSGGATIAREVEQQPPPASEVEHTPARADPDLLSHVLVLSMLGLLQAHREVAVVLGCAEIGEVSQAEPKDSVRQRIGEVDVMAVGHGGSFPDRSHCDQAEVPVNRVERRVPPNSREPRVGSTLAGVQLHVSGGVCVTWQRPARSSARRCCGPTPWPSSSGLRWASPGRRIPGPHAARRESPPRARPGCLRSPASRRVPRARPSRAPQARRSMPSR